MARSVRQDEVDNAFRLFIDEAVRNGVDCGEWVMVRECYPEWARIVGRSSDGAQYGLSIPNGGMLGGTKAAVLASLTGMRYGMRMVRDAREDAAIRERLAKGNG